MLKFRISVLAAAGLLALAGAGSAVASAGGDSNAGDVWLDNSGQPAGPGHEMDPHLACQDINLWGDKLADSSGGFTVNGWPPSGAKEVDYSGTWSYDTSQGGDQVVATISINTLIAQAQANGDSPAHKGYHFKLNFGQDPQKHKTFWVDCPASFQPILTTNSTRHRSARHHHGRTARHRLRSGHHRHRVNRTRISRRPRRTRRTRGFTG